MLVHVFFGVERFVITHVWNSYFLSDEFKWVELRLGGGSVENVKWLADIFVII